MLLFFFMYLFIWLHWILIVLCGIFGCGAQANELWAWARHSLCTTTKDPMPSNAYLYYYQQIMDYYHLVAYYYGIDVDVLMSYYGLNEMTVMQEALNLAKYNMVLFVLMEQNELSWTEEEFTEKYEEYVAKYLESNKDASQEDAKAYADGMKNQIELDLAEEKVLIWSFGMIFPSDAE